MNFEMHQKATKPSTTTLLRFEDHLAVFEQMGMVFRLAAPALEERIKNLRAQGFSVDPEMAALAELNYRNGKGYGSALHEKFAKSEKAS